jgi:hypothetical protein
MRGGAVATMTESKQEKNSPEKRLQSIVDNMEFVDMSD